MPLILLQLFLPACREDLSLLILLLFQLEKSQVCSHTNNFQRVKYSEIKVCETQNLQCTQAHIKFAFLILSPVDKTTQEKKYTYTETRLIENKENKKNIIG